ncbi:hypothetical protein VTN77DRAFT_5732 [Rasamsonia byssochlamydoides]|uniref:uncharacterized protein n=1 Tax=Rasamsonia byssochlamydoides TaxID=89139 RepID=UPI0037420D0A
MVKFQDLMSKIVWECPSTLNNPSQIDNFSRILIWASARALTIEIEKILTFYEPSNLFLDEWSTILDLALLIGLPTGNVDAAEILIEKGADELVEHSLPDLLVGKRHTKAPAWHDIKFIGRLSSWTTFERSVRKARDSAQLDQQVVLDYYLPSQHEAEFHLSREQLYVGDEYSVQSRILQRVGHVLGGICKFRGIDVRFGDSKLSNTEMAGIPDICLFDSNGEMLVAGEIKTPWVHSLSYAFLSSDLLRKALGQIAQYMLGANVRFGFLSTYDETIFLRQDPDPDNTESFILWYSNVIRHKTTSQPVPEGKSGRQNFWWQVSLRECFLLLILETQPESNRADKHRAGNNTPENRWIGPRNARVPAKFEEEAEEQVEEGGEDVFDNPNTTIWACRGRDSWKLEEKIAENSYQLSASEANTFPEGLSEAVATFACCNVHNEVEKAILKIRMQIPNRGTEFDPPRSRAAQAFGEPGTVAQDEYAALEQLKMNNCSSAPTLLKYVKRTQDADMLVPGGYIVYFLVNRLPGVPLHDFWEREPLERQEIRDAFKAPWV